MSNYRVTMNVELEFEFEDVSEELAREFAREIIESVPSADVYINDIEVEEVE